MKEEGKTTPIGEMLTKKKGVVKGKVWVGFIFLAQEGRRVIKGGEESRKTVFWEMEKIFWG